jgi:hypothetical protein
MPSLTESAIDFDALRAQRDERGRFVKGSPGPALQDGQRSALLLKQPNLATLHADLVAAVRDERGGDRLSTVSTALIEEWAGVRLMTAAQRYKAFNSTKERSRQRALDRYQSLLDRFMRLSSLVGLDREAKPVEPLAEVLDGD